MRSTIPLPLPWTWRDALAYALPLLLAVPLAGCPTGGTVVDDDDTTDGDDDTGDDDTADDDMWTDDDDGTPDDDDDGTPDDDDDDTAGTGDPCTVSFGPPQDPFELTGTCGDDPQACPGGVDPMDAAGSCAGGLVCCVDTDQCEGVLGGGCAADEDDCEGDPPPGAPGFPMLGCPQVTPYCCLPSGPPQ